MLNCLLIGIAYSYTIAIVTVRAPYRNLILSCTIESEMPGLQEVEGPMMMKLLMSWDIKAGREQSYSEFAVREFVPGLMRLGLQPTEVWYTIFGEGPQILAGGVTEDLETMRRILNSEEWRQLHAKLMTYVTGYQQKVVPASGRFQL